MGYEPKVDAKRQTQLPQLSAVASSKIKEIAEICNAQIKADKVSSRAVTINFIIHHSYPRYSSEDPIVILFIVSSGWIQCNTQS